jgi:hypothetical protein
MKYVLPSFTTGDGDTQEDIGDSENDYLNHLFDISNAIATCGGWSLGPCLDWEKISTR